MTIKVRCQPRHQFAPTRGADRPSIMVPGEMLPQKCDLCAARYPCAHACDHIDCRIERGEALPDWVTEVKSSSTSGVLGAERGDEDAAAGES